MPPQELHIPFTPEVAELVGIDGTSALVDGALGTGGPRVLFAHGAGAPKDSAFMAGMARRWSEAGALVVRFDYPYMERARREGRRRPPDRAPKLVAAHRDVLRAVRERCDAADARWFLAGKSMGARMSTLLLSEDADLDVAGAVLLGYPLHPAKKPESLRSEHFDRLVTPTLFVSGTRDPLCDLDLFERERTSIAGPHELFVVDGGDHDLAVPKRSGRTHDDVLDEVARESLRFMEPVR
ncbi:Alpha/beta hydrolase family protein [Planctomycetes bacterium Pla163]|uniref:Alpha/beta hydrolase family protein n=1 Tax=Rohdeia mirabilis TaxID=2528008 RepID=A0A518D4H1_9BACT|nr:Alpha/beta hydrolase family protein [Planctomycetes bacterium Pla163]